MGFPYLLVVLAWPGGVVGVAQTTTSARPLPSYELAWLRAPGTESCPSGSDLAREVAAYVGPSSAGRGERAFEAQVSHAGSSFEASLRLRDREGKLLGERTLTSDDCASLLRATAFAIALAIDPNVVQRSKPTLETDTEPAENTTRSAPGAATSTEVLVEPAPLPSRDDARAPVQTPEAPPARSAPTASELAFGAWGRAAVAFLLLPAPRVAPELGASVALDRSRLTLGAGYYASTHTDDGHARVGLTSFWLAGGHSFGELESWWFGAEAGLGVGAWHAQAQGEGFRERLFIGPRIGGYVTRSIVHGLSLELSASVVFPLHRYEFTTNGQGFHVPFAGVLAGAGISYEDR